MGDLRVEQEISAKFKCAKCGGTSAQVRKLAMVGAGLLERITDWQRNKYYFVTCRNCGYTKVYDARVLDGKGGTLGDIIDLLFGG
ncbi:zinc ribbon domain-containing protein [Candidatus Bipolaricaulota sp. J31]